MDSPACFCHTLLMAAPSPTPSTLARDLLFNPARCEVGDSTCPPATMVLEAVVAISIADSGRKYWLTCDRIVCLNDAQQLADSYRPAETDLRDVTVGELAELSGLEIPVAA